MSHFFRKLPFGMPSRRPVALPSAGYVLALVGALLTALLLGAVVALGAIELTIVAAGVLVCVPVLLFASTRVLLPVMFVAVFLVSGTAQYFFSMRLATWMASGLSALFFARAIFELCLPSTFANERKGPLAGGSTAVAMAAGLYLLFYFFSIALGHASTIQLVSVLRFCLPMFGVLFALYWFKWSERRILVLWTLIVLITIAQLPLTLYQHFFNISSMGWDGVVGSFGGGMSPVLVLFTVTAMLYMLARWSRGLTPLWQVAGFAVVVFAVILLGEVKAVFVWLPLGAFWVLRRVVLKNVLAFVLFGVLMSGISAGIFTAYHLLYWGEHTKTETVEDKVNSVGAYAVDPNGINYVTGEISRGASLALWYSDPVPTVQQRLIGYGPGASLTSSATGRGVVAARYRNLMIGATGLAALLWDVGVLGSAAFCAIFLTGLALGVRYVRAGVGSPQRMAIVDTCTVMTFLFMSSLVYNKTLVDEPSMQLLAYFCLGCIVQCARYGADAPQKAP